MYICIVTSNFLCPRHSCTYFTGAPFSIRKAGQPLNDVVQKAFKKAVLISDTSVEEKVFCEVDDNDLRSINKSNVYEALKDKGVVSGENDEW